MMLVCDIRKGWSWRRWPTARWLASVVALVTLVACSADPLSDAEKRQALEKLFAECRREFPDTPALDVEAALELAERKDAIWLDVREAEERAVSTLPGAVSIEDFERGGERYAGRPVIVYCTIGHRSGLDAKHLRAEGFDAYNLKGGVLSWTHAGRPLVDSAGKPTKRVHVYGKKWNLAPDDYEPVW